jgi:hypothetical protein
VNRQARMNAASRARTATPARLVPGWLDIERGT